MKGIQVVQALLCIMLLGGALALPGLVAAQERQTMSEAVHVQADQQVNASVATVWRDIVIEGEVLGDVTSLTGSIHISGVVHGDVVSYSGAVWLDDTAHVAGSVLVLTGNVTRTAHAQIAGTLIGDTNIGSVMTASTTNFAAPAQSVAFQHVWYVLLGVVGIVLTLAMTVAGATIWAARTMAAAHLVQLVPVRVATVGLLTQLLLNVLLVVVGMVFTFTLIGLPLLVPLLLVLHLPFLYALVILARALVHPRTGRRSVPLVLVGSIGLLLVPLVVGWFVPVASLILFYLLAAPGLGALLLGRASSLATAPAA
ncbi:MAG: polymer-forming cytoskeletal protein [Chloroflexaceae bacterium]|nr:polymer-forming cytoskeletal protein [Chloroflexaceae bacterium]NJO04191.1 polymer-forming cytoskeletal protein [Chloroflexaceae bacterium]